MSGKPSGLWLLLPGALLFLWAASKTYAADFTVGFSGGSIPFDPIFDLVCKRNGVPKRLMLAHVFVESKFDPKAVNFEASADRRLGRNVDSIGLCQILYPDTAQAYRPGITRDQLFDPETNLSIGSMVVKDFLRRFPNQDGAGFPADAVAAYNAGTPKHNASGAYINQDYVDQVREAWIGYEGA